MKAGNVEFMQIIVLDFTRISTSPSVTFLSPLASFPEKLRPDKRHIPNFRARHQKMKSEWSEKWNSAKEEEWADEDWGEDGWDEDGWGEDDGWEEGW